MIEEIRQQPDVIRGVIASQFNQVEALRMAIQTQDIRFGYIAARGASDNVAHYAKYVLEIEHGIPVALAAPSVFTIYDAVPKLDSHTLVIGISQSGEALDVLAVCERARKSGALTACITNNPDSPLASAVDHPLFTMAGVEQSVIATKTYTTALAVVALLSTALSVDRPDRLDTLRRTADQMQNVLTLDNPIKMLVQRYKDIKDCVVIGRGYNHCTAAQVALNITEAALVGAKSFSAADFLHGPIAIVNQGYPVILIAASGRGFEVMQSLAERLRASHPAIISFAHDPTLLAGSETAIRIPGAIPEWLSPLVYVIAGQLFAHWLAIAKGLDPDHPRGLTKVTRTR
jgi:glucosamine--fructose-6-phosphate aminotransferase (isomerizing)